MRWWQAAFTVARELKLNIDRCPLPTLTSHYSHHNANANPQPETTMDPWFDFNWFSFEYDVTNVMTTNPDLSMQADLTECGDPLAEEQCEERRRTWWLLYIQDRYLALCYNRAISTLDAECAGLLLPTDELTRQPGTFMAEASTGRPMRPRFPSFEGVGLNIFGFCLPLMTILGEILDHGRNLSHPLLGPHYRGNGVSSAVGNDIIHHITMYQNSLTRFETLHQETSLPTEGYHDQNSLQKRIVVAYATCISHILHAPLSATTHAVKAADVGSLVLLMVLDGFHINVEPSVIAACKAIVRATKACMAALDIEYQRQYRRILSSAIAQARGRSIHERKARHRRTRVLAMYRRTCNGTRLAL
ncbi:uncharacterized protein Z518_03539 [Rhinocladiella mackenziei CBS 650.93]|uniref:Rhinocladiella mackenziei CBS 650.93 unplaced genomic scaffold supercont1.2, whole genome shotgun sequence n=1 Tax=Rhinocladiella mackenziei CBS 650.93 TaxID=1442369 RepID=A0A0D2G2V5_9EURO|nr:uncharacterized protein Z518_03539 [Rhinocladiella mackenziei CBS 650.93]KIX08882.1 hypothetical protein Z518_03539 [Rhinocladiella mackenziei CBS 650.93]